ncbi:MAG: hypothetical protein M0Z87_12065 [Actinomycetota bacterium]|nr:hypothetical protein [Actinomycetota bacterium]
MAATNRSRLPRVVTLAVLGGALLWASAPSSSLLTGSSQTAPLVRGGARSSTTTAPSKGYSQGGGASGRLPEPGVAPGSVPGGLRSVRNHVGTSTPPGSRRTGPAPASHAAAGSGAAGSAGMVRRTVPVAKTGARPGALASPRPHLSTSLRRAAPVAADVAAQASSTGVAASGSLVDIPPTAAMSRWCFSAATRLQCDSASLLAIDAARSSEGLGPLKLPSNWSSLDSSQQLFVVTNLERIARGLAPIGGLSVAYDRMALQGARMAADPTGPSTSRWASNWATGYADALATDFIWMYDDGQGSFNVACTPSNPSSCWDHRANILWGWPAGAATSMGAGTATVRGAVSTGELFVGAAGAPYAMTWAQESAYLAAPPVAAPGGYYLVTARGNVLNHGAPWRGSVAAARLAHPVVGLASTATGYYLVTSAGNVFNFGAPWHGSVARRTLGSPVVGMATDPRTGGYWLATAAGNVYQFGGAPWLGSAAGGGTHLKSPVVGIAADPLTGGYWLLTKGGNVYNFGAPWLGSPLMSGAAAPLVSIAPDAATGGYWAITKAGRVYGFQAGVSSTLPAPPGAPVVAIAADRSSSSFWVATATGTAYSPAASPVAPAAGASISSPVVGAACN